MCHGHFEHSSVREGRGPCDALVDQAAEPVHVALGCSLLSLDQLGREIGERPENLTGLRENRVGLASGQSEIRQCGASTAAEHDVGRLDVSVHDVMVMERPEAGGDL